ncbi:hypothetical protein CFP56_040054 [Quercus suber]|uniref:Uncharacterized protein n=1 Tax=Quercus suber TaxID=58331 RepID=A0AAW0LKH2_QUESU
MSLCFIGFVTALHVFGKLYRDPPPPPLNFLLSVSDSELFDRCSRFTLIFGSLTRFVGFY